jgi:hypothetical protein
LHGSQRSSSVYMTMHQALQSARIDRTKTFLRTISKDCKEALWDDVRLKAVLVPAPNTFTGLLFQFIGSNRYLALFKTFIPYAEHQYQRPRASSFGWSVSGRSAVAAAALLREPVARYRRQHCGDSHSAFTRRAQCLTAPHYFSALHA